jgi:hypothetical protein
VGRPVRACQCRRNVHLQGVTRPLPEMLHRLSRVDTFAHHFLWTTLSKNKASRSSSSSHPPEHHATWCVSAMIVVQMHGHACMCLIYSHAIGRPAVDVIFAAQQAAYVGLFFEGRT